MSIETIVLLPEPEGPTIAVDVFDLIVNEAPENTSFAPSGAVGYLNVRFSNLIPS